MSRSYRKPYETIIGGTASEREDKILASRGWRRLMNRSLRSARDFETYTLPLRHEAAYNNRYSWRSDGKNNLRQFPTAWDYVFLAEFGRESFEERRQDWLKLHRK
jgi:hypothetical protein